MSFLLSTLVSLYLSCLLSFSFVTHPIGYCLLLLCCSIIMSGYVYLVFGFIWYVLLFCLVYVGGVYILFVFVSLHSPNPLPVQGGGYEWSVFLFFFSEVVLLGGYDLVVSVNQRDYSQLLCSSSEGLTYCFFCLVLLLGFVAVSVMVGDKDSFYR